MVHGKDTGEAAVHNCWQGVRVLETLKGSMGSLLCGRFRLCDKRLNWNKLSGLGRKVEFCQCQL